MGSPSVFCYPQPGKAKSRRLCDALAAGAGGQVVEAARELEPGPAAFYGAVGIEHLLRAAQARGGWYYSDNAWFDAARGTHYRIARDALQDLAPAPPDWERWRALGVEIAPWRRDGRHVLVVLQSGYFLREVAGWPGGIDGWQDAVLRKIAAHTDRPIVVRHWQRDKAERAKSLAAELKGCWALVTHMSAAANEALLAGVPVFVTGPCAALRMGLSQLEQIETPRRPDGRAEWAAGLAARQWTVEEIAAGMAWRALHGLG
jgi:hypothetical protein